MTRILPMNFRSALSLVLIILGGCESPSPGPTPHGVETSAVNASNVSPDERSGELQELMTRLEIAKGRNPRISIRPDEGVGELRFGMTRREVLAVIGEPYRVTGDYYEYQHLGMAALFDRSGRVSAILCGAWCEPSDVLLDVFKGETAEGIRLRSSDAEVLRVFGEPLEKEELEQTFMIFHYQNASFAFRRGLLVHMTWKSPSSD
jgi:hypothetical protein